MNLDQSPLDFIPDELLVVQCASGPKGGVWVYLVKHQEKANFESRLVEEMERRVRSFYRAERVQLLMQRGNTAEPLHLYDGPPGLCNVVYIWQMMKLHGGIEEGQENEFLATAESIIVITKGDTQPDCWSHVVAPKV